MFRKICLVILLELLFIQMPHAGELGNAIEEFGQSIEGGLDNLGQTLNRANSALLGEPAQANPNSYEAQIRAYRQAENARVQELSAVTGVKPEIISEMRANGMTWEQIANKYNVNLQDLPLPPNVPVQ